MITLDEKTYQVILIEPPLMNRYVDVTRIQWSLLKHLYDNQDRVVTKDELKAILDTPEHDRTMNAVEVHITQLRRKLGSSTILTRRGFGYQLNIGETQ